MEKMIMSFIVAFFQGLTTTCIIYRQLQITKVKISKIIILKLFIVFYFYSFVSFLFVPNQYRFILGIITVIISMFYIIKIKDLTSIIYVFNMSLLTAIGEIIGSLILVFLGVKTTKIVQSNFFNLLANIIISFVQIIILLSKFFKMYVLMTFNIYNKKRKFINYLFILFIIIYLLLAKNGLEFILKSNYYINILFIIGIVLIILIIIKMELKSDKIKSEYVQMLNYVTKYEKIITEQGKNNHEFKNQLMVIRGYAQINNDEKVINYVDSIIEDSKKISSSYLISQLNKFPDGGIKGLLYYKLSIIEEEKINYQMIVDDKIKSKLANLSVDLYKDITKILGVLLDNAIDSAKKSTTKKILIEVNKNKNDITFTLSNTYKGKIKLDEIGTGYTTKGKGHGYGLKLVNDIINSNNVFKLDKELTEDYFISKLNIDMQKKKK